MWQSTLIVAFDSKKRGKREREREREPGQLQQREQNLVGKKTPKLHKSEKVLLFKESSEWHVLCWRMDCWNKHELARTEDRQTEGVFIRRAEASPDPPHLFMHSYSSGGFNAIIWRPRPLGCDCQRGRRLKVITLLCACDSGCQEKRRSAHGDVCVCVCVSDGERAALLFLLNWASFPLTHWYQFSRHRRAQPRRDWTKLKLLWNSYLLFY